MSFLRKESISSKFRGVGNLVVLGKDPRYRDECNERERTLRERESFRWVDDTVQDGSQVPE